VKKQDDATYEQKKILTTLLGDISKKDRAIGKCEKKIYLLKKKT
jgi:hypothetical protein